MKRWIKKNLITIYDMLRFWSIENKCNNKKVSGNPIALQPILKIGLGKIFFGENVSVGYYPSPLYYSTYAHIESRRENAVIKIGDNTMINNNLIVIADQGNITIGVNCLLGCNVQIINSDFHEIDPLKRNSGLHISQDINIADNVFIGNNVIILKGVVIGKNSVIASGSVVTKSFEDNSIIGGNPAKLIKKID